MPDTVVEVSIASKRPSRKTLVRKSIQRSSKKLKRPQKRTRAKKTPEKKLREELWDLCRKITEKRYPNTCFTCGKPAAGANRHLGHFIPRSAGGNLLKYHLDNLRWQCYYDNINLGGNGSEFYRKLVQEIGQQRVDALFELKTQTVKANRQFYLDKITEYKELLITYETQN